MVTGGEPLEPDIVTDRIGRFSPIRAPLIRPSLIHLIREGARGPKVARAGSQAPLTTALIWHFSRSMDAGLNALELGTEDSLL